MEEGSKEEKEEEEEKKGAQQVDLDSGAAGVKAGRGSVFFSRVHRAAVTRRQRQRRGGRKRAFK